MYLTSPTQEDLKKKTQEIFSFQENVEYKQNNLSFFEFNEDEQKPSNLKLIVR